MTEVRALLAGLGIGESARWHDGRLWFCNWGRHEVVASDLEGHCEVIAQVPANVGYAIDWLPDGRLLVTGPELLRREAGGTLVRHADLSRIGEGWNEIVVDGRGNIYVNGMRADARAGAQGFGPGVIALVTPDGAVRQVAGEIAFPNGMIVTPDNRTLIIAESFAGQLTAFDIADDGSLANRRLWAKVPGDGICLDLDGAVWCQSFEEGSRGAVMRVREGGEVLDRIQLEHPCFACTLGGEDGKTLFMMSAEWWGFERLDELLSARTGRVLVAPAPAPHAGYP
ncbi:MAG: SMP-30/gluconolactonase/LRE family protein [Nitrososphaerales archaeon]